jgi:poly-gamma-glutamate synthesis protein (capsule biosynthesis protein)
MVKICITGDISFANIQEHKIGLYLKSIFENSNLFVGNLEAVFTNYDRRRKLHPYHLKADKSLLNTIKIFDSFSLANNHILDYGKKGFEDTIAVMKENGKYFFEAGNSKKEAEKPFTNKINGIKIAIWGVSHFAN